MCHIRIHIWYRVVLATPFSARQVKPIRAGFLFTIFILNGISMFNYLCIQLLKMVSPKKCTSRDDFSSETNNGNVHAAGQKMVAYTLWDKQWQRIRRETNKDSVYAVRQTMVAYTSWDKQWKRIRRETNNDSVYAVRQTMAAYTPCDKQWHVTKGGDACVCTSLQISCKPVLAYRKWPRRVK